MPFSSLHQIRINIPPIHHYRLVVKVTPSRLILTENKRGNVSRNYFTIWKHFLYFTPIRNFTPTFQPLCSFLFNQLLFLSFYIIQDNDDSHIFLIIRKKICFNQTRTLYVFSLFYLVKFYSSVSKQKTPLLDYGWRKIEQGMRKEETKHIIDGKLICKDYKAMK